MADVAPVPVRLIQPEWSGRVPAPAHDSLSPEERRRYLARNPDSYLTVTRAPEDLPPGHAWDVNEALESSRVALDRLLGAGAFSPLIKRRFHLYRLTIDGHTQVGIVGGISVDDYDDGVIRIHERIKAPRANHLATHLEGLRVQSSPITLAHRPQPAIADAVAAALDGQTAAVVDVVGADGLHQQVWSIDDPDVVEALRHALTEESLYLIDGHHRAAAASTYRARMTAAGTIDPGAARMLCVIFAAPDLRNEAFHRALHHLDLDDLRTRVGALFPVRPASGIDAVLDREAHELALWAEGRWHLVAIPGDEPRSAEAALAAIDPVRLQQRVLSPLLGLDESTPTDVLSYHHGLADRADLEAIERSEHPALWVMRPVPMSVLMETSDASLVMPPKSTYFAPKVRSGVFLHSFDR